MMNDRLEELKRKAVAEADVSHIDFDNMSQTDIRMLGDIAVEKKFAELIVRECAQICRDQTNDFALELDRENCASAIEEHFGVEK